MFHLFTREKGIPVKQQNTPKKTTAPSQENPSAAPEALLEGEIEDEYEPPDDFEEQGGEYHPWVNKPKMIGKPFMGILKGRFPKLGKRSKGGFGFTIKLTKTPRGGVPCLTGDPDTGETINVVCRKGDLVSLDHTKGLNELEELIKTGGTYEVYLKIKGVKQLDSGNTFYEWRRAAKCVAPPAPLEDDKTSF